MINLELFPEEEPKKPKKPSKAKKPPKAKKAKDDNHGFYSFMVKSFLVDEKKTTFIFQYKQAKKLFEEIPEKKFWQWLVGEGRKIYSLKEWLKPKEIGLLKNLNKKRLIQFPPKKKYKLEKHSLGMDKKGLIYNKNLIIFTDNE
jgi:hypothetical protein